MLQVLVESRGMRQQNGSWTLLSFTVHSAIVVVAVMLTARAVPEPSVPEKVHVVRFTPAAPVEAAARAPAGAPVPGSIAMPTISIPRILFEIPEDHPTRIIGQLLSELGNLAASSTVGTSAGGAVAPGGIHTESSVDRIVRPLAGNPSPAYPSRLAGAGIEGDALVRFVVDTSGRVEPPSVEILAASHALFGESVKRWLSQTRYSPAQVNGRPVRQLVQQRVGFSLTR